MVKKKKAGRGLGKIKGFSIRFLPYSEIRGIDTSARIRKILNIRIIRTEKAGRPSLLQA